MEKVISEQIFHAIKSDNLSVFSRLITGHENLSFGRFPILSLCYLYNAKKITKAYFSVLCKLSEYAYVTEYFEIYQSFKNVAGRALRLYSNCNISPLEMLAILHKDSKVKKYFNIFAKSDIILNNLKTIYSINSQKVAISTMAIKISRPPLTNLQRKKSKFAIIVGGICSAVLIITYLLAGFTIGLGTSSLPYKITTARQLSMALNSGGYYTITKNITLEDLTTDLSFNGELNGDGHTIYVKNSPKNSLISVNNGTLGNLNIVYENIDENISSSLSLFVGTNNGKIHNVKVNCESLTLNCTRTPSQDIYISSIATTNNGTISNCDVELSAKLSASSQGECYVSGLVGKNLGSVTNCNFISGSIETTEIDIAGIVSQNDVKGVVQNCRNYVSLTQTSTLDEWSPSVGGIVVENYGLIDNSYNYGKVSITSSGEDTSYNVCVAGVSALNYGNVTKCLNKGEIYSSSQRLVTYVGGITAYSSYWIENNQGITPVINGCGSVGNISFTSEHEDAFVFAGGISGYLYGEVSSCYSLAMYTNGYDESKYFVGSCVGSSYLQYQFFQNVICLSASNNYMLDQSNVLYQIGALINNATIVSTGLDTSNNEIISGREESEIKEKEVYWDE